MRKTKVLSLLFWKVIKMKKTTANKIDFILIVSPGVSIIDAWIPVLEEVKQIDPAIVIGVLILEKKLLRSFSETDPYIRKLLAVSRTWYLCRAKRDRVAFLEIDRMKGFRADSWLKKLLTLVLDPFASNCALVLEEVAHSNCAFLYDVNEWKHEKVRLLHRISGNRRWHSIPHGSDLRFREKQAEKYHINDCLNPKDVCYVPAEQEINSYKERYGIPEKNIMVTGIPKHDMSWIESVVKEKKFSKNKNSYIVVISRPSNPGYFPAHEKKRVLRLILAIAEEFDLDVVVRLHPKESKIDGFVEVFGEDQKRIEFSGESYLALAKNALCAFSFFSSVALDLICMNTPVIEPLDYKECRDSFKLWRDKNGNPASQYQYYGFVISATQYDEVEFWMKMIIDNRFGIGHSLRENYLSVYKDPSGACNYIARRIVDEVGGQKKN